VNDARVTFHRARRGSTETLTLHGPSYSITIELTVRGIELDATTLERLLHAPLTLIASRETI
jgi:hypothetical protein